MTCNVPATIAAPTRKRSTANEATKGRKDDGDTRPSSKLASTPSSSSGLSFSAEDIRLLDGDKNRSPPDDNADNGGITRSTSVDSLSDQLIDISMRMAQGTNKAIKEVKRYLHFHELPEHLKDNLYILTGYRANYSIRECLKSVFAIHNETGNIWTHLLGSIFFVFCLIIGLQSIPAQAAFLDYFVMVVFLLSAIKCLLCSSIFHTFSAHSHPSVYDSVAILDYSGISLLIFGSFVIYLNYSLYCFNTLRWVYIGILSFLCASGVILPWFPFFRKTSFRVYRTLFFVGMGITAGLISAHTIYLNGWTHWSDLVPIEYLVIEIVFYLLGAYVYVVRVPEAWFPGRLDHWLHSHQVWHIFVFLAAWFHYLASIHFMKSRLTQDTCASFVE